MTIAACGLAVTGLQFSVVVMILVIGIFIYLGREILVPFAFSVLLAIVRLEDGAYGRAILKDVQGRLERDVGLLLGPSGRERVLHEPERPQPHRHSR